MSAMEDSSAFARPDDFSRRQVLDLSQAVRAVRFRRRDWERAAQIREAIDLDLRVPQTPRAERNDDPAESIVMFANVIENRMTTGAHVVRQTRTVDLPTLPELAIAAPLAFETVTDTTLQSDAAAALDRLATRKPHGRRGHRLPRPAAPKAPRSTSTGATVAVIVIAVITVALLLRVVLAGRLF
jgi:hypothetical protein